MKFGAVAIGRNEGARLRRCLESVSTAAAVVYVDSGSTDGSVQLALDRGAHVNRLSNAPARSLHGNFSTGTKAVRRQSTVSSRTLFRVGSY